MSGRDVVVTGIGLVSCAGEGIEAASGGARRAARAAHRSRDLRALSGPSRRRRSIGTGRSPRNPTSARWRPGRGSAAMRRASPSMRPASRTMRPSRAACTWSWRPAAASATTRSTAQILTGLRARRRSRRLLNERLMGDLRPTLFLAQLSNLLAGNISIVHGVTGASRTFMGEEASGVDAMRIAHARIASGQNDIFLVGGAYNAERPDVLLIYELGGFSGSSPSGPSGSARRTAAAWSSEAAPPSWCWKRASTPRRGAPSRSPRSPASRPTAPGASPAASARARAPGRRATLAAKPGRHASPARPAWRGDHGRGAGSASPASRPTRPSTRTGDLDRPHAWRRRRPRASALAAGARRRGRGRRGAGHLRRPSARRGRRAGQSARGDEGLDR